MEKLLYQWEASVQCFTHTHLSVERIKEMPIVRLIIIIDNGIIRVYADYWLSGCMLVAVGSSR